jgi:hypothetical protein
VEAVAGAAAAHPRQMGLLPRAHASRAKRTDNARGNRYRRCRCVVRHRNPPVMRVNLHEASHRPSTGSRIDPSECSCLRRAGGAPPSHDEKSGPHDTRQLEVATWVAEGKCRETVGRRENLGRGLRLVPWGQP